MLRYDGMVELGFGDINDDRVLTYIGEFDQPNSKLERTVEVTRFINPVTHETMFGYKGDIFNLSELRLTYLKDFYEVK